MDKTTGFNPEQPLRNWNCPRCNEELGEYNAYCEYCKYDFDIIIYNPSTYFIREIRIEHIRRGEKAMTPQEQLFSDLFNHEKVLVKDMDLLELRAHRETLAKIAFEARARLTAVDDEENDRKKKSSNGKPQGFERSVNTDETTTNAINTIKERQTRMSKQEKLLEGLQKMYEKSGMSKEDALKEATRLSSAGTILTQTRIKDAKEVAAKEQVESKTSESESKPTFFNPFGKK